VSIAAAPVPACAGPGDVVWTGTYLGASALLALLSPPVHGDAARLVHRRRGGHEQDEQDEQGGGVSTAITAAGYPGRA
jgi:hypothetical protein